MKRTIANGRKLITLLSVLSILAVSVFSAFIGVDFTAVAEAPESVEEIWGGYYNTIASVSFEGEGTAVNPYIITNGDQLYKMVSTYGKTNDAPAYYKLGADIYLNDITNYDKWGTKKFDMSTLNNWYENHDFFNYPSSAFLGHFDGDGHTIYGLYATGYRHASFFPAIGTGATVKNVHFRNSYCVNVRENPEVDRMEKDFNSESIKDLEGYDSGNGVTSGNRTWYDGTYGTAAVLAGYCGSTTFSVSNCSVRDAYVEASYFTAGLIGFASSATVTVTNCLVADIELNATSTEDYAYGLEAGIINNNYPTGTTTMQGVISAGYRVYGADNRDTMWGGYNYPSISEKVTFKNVYSDVAHDYTANTVNKGIINFTESEINVVKSGYLIGDKAQEKLDLDWEHNWKVVDGDYPVPLNEYIAPTGDDYYANGGPKATEDVWDGTTAKNYAAGTGTLEDPYLIENCEQLYLMATTLNADKYYKVADGVTALYFNDVKGLNYSETLNALRSKKMHVYAPGEENNFSGYFDGNGVTIYGIKSEGKLRAGLIPQAGNATLKNFTVKNSQFNANDGLADTATKTEGAAAIVADLSTSAAVSIRNVAVIDCNVTSNQAAAGFIACSHISGCVFIDDCIVSGGEIMSDLGSTDHAAFVATSSSGTHIIKNSIALGIYPAADNSQSYLSSFKNVYTDFDAPSSLVAASAAGVKQVKTDELKGDAVKKTAKEFDWENTWTATKDIPELKKHVSVLGAVKEAWSGAVSDIYAGGDGSVNNPYQIDTPERLAQMLVYCKPGAYYTLTEHIYINDVSADNWKENATYWLTSADVEGFTGIFDGNGYTVYGLYNTDIQSGVYAGLVPVLTSGGELRNVKVDNAYLSGKSGAAVGAVVGAIEDNSTNITIVRAAQVGSNVELAGEADAGGIVGRVGFTKLRLDNCLFTGSIISTGKSGGIAGDVVGKIDAKESISVGIAPFASAENVSAKAIYTDAACDIEGVTVLESDNLKGEAPKTYMTDLDWNGTWVTTDEYPMPIYKVKSFDGVQGEVWTGEIATKYAGGKGTAEEPYLIATGEQLALAITKNNWNGNVYYKMICDIYLNDVSDDLWAAKVGCNTWIHNTDMQGQSSFAGHFDGDGYVVYGMYYNYVSTPQNSYLGLFPKVGGSAEIKNVGVSQAYIKAAIGDESVYAGGLFGMGSGFYDFYNNKTTPDATVNDEFLVPGQETPTKLPSFTNCFVDHTCYIEANAVGGIGNPGGAVIVIRDCIVTASLVGKSDAYAGGLIGNQWSEGSRIYNSVSFPQTDNKFSCGTHQWVNNEASICFAIEDSYYYGSMSIFGATRVTRPMWRVGEEAKTAMPNLDWENTWRVEEDGTPVLRIFDKEGRSASVFSDKNFHISDVQINFITGDAAIVIDPIVGKPYDSIGTLPTPTRLGYEFKGWHAYPDFSLEYPYEYFLSRDINLYAEWKKIGLIQDFESYTYSSYDCDLSRWNYNKPGSRGGYNFDYVHTGTKSMQLLNNSADSADLLLNYEEWLTVDQDYTMTFWVATDTANTATTLSLVQNNYPDYIDTEVSVEPMVTVTGLQVGEWKQYSYSFTAKTNWVSIRVTGNSSLFIDDVVIAPTGTIINNNYVNGDLSAVSPSTFDAATVVALVSAIVSCAIILVITKKNPTEIIERN